MADDISLPKATLNSACKALLPAGIRCAPETRALLSDCCVEFVQMLSAESMEQCLKAGKKTISPAHVVSALKDLGLEQYETDVQNEIKQLAKKAKSRPKKRKLKDSGFSEEELLRQQEMLFAKARNAMESEHTTMSGESGALPSSHGTPSGNTADAPPQSSVSVDADLDVMTPLDGAQASAGSSVVGGASGDIDGDDDMDVMRPIDGTADTTTAVTTTTTTGTNTSSIITDTPTTSLNNTTTNTISKEVGVDYEDDFDVMAPLPPINTDSVSVTAVATTSSTTTSINATTLATAGGGGVGGVGGEDSDSDGLGVMAPLDSPSE